MQLGLTKCLGLLHVPTFRVVQLDIPFVVQLINLGETEDLLELPKSSERRKENG